MQVPTMTDRVVLVPAGMQRRRLSGRNGRRSSGGRTSSALNARCSFVVTFSVPGGSHSLDFLCYAWPLLAATGMVASNRITHVCMSCLLAASGAGADCKRGEGQAGGPGRGGTSQEGRPATGVCAAFLCM